MKKQAWTRVTAVFMTLTFLLAFAGCGQKEATVTDGAESAETASASTKDLIASEDGEQEEEVAEEEPQNAYNLGNASYKIRNVAQGTYLCSTTLSYLASETYENAMTFYLKPSDLGEYMMYDEDSEYLATEYGAVNRGVSVYEDVLWAVEQVGEGSFTLYNTATEKYLTALGSALTMTDKATEASYWAFDEAETVNEYPEITTNVVLKDDEGNEVTIEKAMSRPATDEDIYGYVDTHAHLFHNLGSGEVVFAGATFSNLGVTDALKDCTYAHGVAGTWDIWGKIVDGDIEHDTSGYPNFTMYPNAFSTTHNQTYYKWLERAYLSGERIMVMQCVNNSVLGGLTNILPPYRNGDTDDMVVARKQIQATYDLQDYIDAQCGGEGKGWFRVVTNSSEAREVISQGKMAIFIGIEVDELFGATEDVIGQYEAGEISEDAMNEELNRLEECLQEFKDLGVSSMFPIHAMDNGFGGCQLYQGQIMNIENFLATGDFLTAEDATNVRVYFKEEIGTGDSQGDANAVGLTETGKWFIEKMIEYKYVIEVDHMSDKALNDTLDICWDNKYPGIIVSHTRILDMFTPASGAWEQIDIPRMIKLLQLGGFVSVMAIETTNGHQICVSDYLEQMIKISAKAKRRGKEALSTVYKNSDYEQYDGPYTVPSTWYNVNDDTDDDLIVAVGFGTDVNGACNLPMLEDQSENNVYGYYDGQFDAVDYDDGSFTALYDNLYSDDVDSVLFERQVSGNRTFDINEDAVAHYGLIPDLIQMWKSNPDVVNIDATFQSAEGYLRMRERVEKYSDTYPSRDSAYWIDVDDINGVSAMD